MNRKEVSTEEPYMSKELVKSVLEEIAGSEMPPQSDPWPAIRERIETGQLHRHGPAASSQQPPLAMQPPARPALQTGRVRRPSFSMAAAMIVLLALSAGAVAFLAGLIRLKPGINYGSLPACWSIVANPNIEDGDTILTQLSATSANDVWAVGYTVTGGTVQTLVQKWDGKEWKTIPSANAPSRNSYLSGVAALAPDDVWAVGHSCTGDCQDAAPLVQHWDGRTWNIMTVPGTGRLTAVDALAADDVWAVGYSNGGTISIRWDGRMWNSVPTNDPPAANRALALHSVVAVAADEIWAVGQQHDTQANSYSALIYRWDGARWTSVQGVDGPQGARLYAVDSSPEGDVWAAGDRDTNPSAGAPLQTLVQRWDGTAWREITSPNVGLGGSYLRGLEAISPTDVWAVGGYGGVDEAKRTLLLHWDGAAWTRVPSPNVEDQSSRFFGAEAVGGGEIWAVGTFNKTHTGAFVQRYSPCAPTTPTSRDLPVPDIR
jgi:hypothetical protein